MSRAIITAAEWLARFVSGGRLFVCLALALLFLPLTLGIITFLVIVGIVWYGLHVHIAVGTAITCAMCALAYLSAQSVLPDFRLDYRCYSYEWNKVGEYKRVIQVRDGYYTYSLISKIHMILLAPWLGAIVWHAENGGKYPLYKSTNDYTTEDDEGMRKALIDTAWLVPAYLALTVSVIITIAHFVNVLFYGNADTAVSNFIHGFWEYLAAKLGA